MDFVKKHKKIILNLLVIVAVLLAIYSKWTKSGEQGFFRETDIYIFAGVVLGFLVLNFFNRFKKKR